MQTIVLASNNRGKLQELQELLRDLPITLTPQAALLAGEAEETGLSFVENAILKARHACRATGLPAIADDSGLEVDALDGAPGIYSARYASPHANTNASDADNNALLLARLAGVPRAKRTARFQCAIVLQRFADDPQPLVCQGTWEGLILEAPAGANGFGYDPLFFVPTHHCSSAELAPDVKNALSHRGQALRQLRERWPFR
jgi:XTP/dITP diphosphohydrolase